MSLHKYRTSNKRKTNNELKYYIIIITSSQLLRRLSGCNFPLTALKPLCIIFKNILLSPVSKFGVVFFLVTENPLRGFGSPPAADVASTKTLADEHPGAKCVKFSVIGTNFQFPILA